LKRAFSRFIGVDLGGGRGKTTAIAEIRSTASGAQVVEVATRSGRLPWTDDTLLSRLMATSPSDAVIAIDAPLTQAACGRCERPVCPGMEACADPAVIWLRTEGRALIRKVAVETVGGGSRPAFTAQARLAPYAHRATEIVMTYERGLLPLSAIGNTSGAIAARAGQIRRRLRGLGFELHANLLEVSPIATVTALCGARAGPGYNPHPPPRQTPGPVS
jgi:hypothetical protein